MGVMSRIKEPAEVFESVWVAAFASNSRPDMKHFTLWDPFDKVVVSCSCEGYQAHGYCWHKDWVEENWA
jgi:hypothetical protein